MRHPFSPRSPVFAHLNARELALFDQIGTATAYQCGEQVYCQESSADHVYRILRGQVHLSYDSADGHTLIVRVAYAGDVLGMAPVFLEVAYSSSAFSVTDCEIQVIGRTSFLNLFRSCPAIRHSVSRALAVEYLEVVDYARMLHLARNTAERIVSVLLSLADESHLRRPFVFQFTHGELAGMAGCSRESVSRTLRDLEAAGVIQVRGQMISFHAPEKLMLASSSIRAVLPVKAARLRPSRPIPVDA
jgi:CRP/FNR family cyclic AMP-dependent transcriptional regulator